MATADVAVASLGPQYAPDDPTLLKPWKGLIDGSTGVLYYWNPENNITQYEKPANLEPLVPLGGPSFASTPKLAPLPIARSLQQNATLTHHGQDMSQTLRSQGQQLSQAVQHQGLHQPQQQSLQMSEGTQQQQSMQMAQGVQQQGQQMAQGVQPNWQPMPHQVRHQQMPHQLEQQTRQHEGQPMSHPQGQQFPRQQQQLPFQLTPQMQGQQVLQPQVQQVTYQQGQQMGFSRREESEFQRGKETRFSPQIQQPGVPFFQNHPQPGSSLVQSQQRGTGSVVHQQEMGRPMFQGQAGSAIVHDQQPDGRPMGFKMGYKDDLHGRAGNEFHFNADKGGSVIVPQQPKLGTVPLPQNSKEMGVPHSVTSGYTNVSNLAAGHAMGHVKDLVTGGQAFTRNAAVVPLPVAHGSSDVTNLSDADIYCREHEVTATGDNVPVPFMTFEATGFPPEILREIHLAGFSSPTPIQAQTWPISLQSRDIVAIAKTGSGKTLGYLIPAFIHLRQCRNSSQKSPRVLILAPTRELATQIHDEAIKFGRSSGISCTCLYGGAPKGPQIRELDRGVDIIVATPGRLNDILEMKKVDFHQVAFLVLDEADRMLDMGFEPQIRKIVNEIPPHRQTLMYTATWPKEVRKIAGDLLANPVQVNIGRVDELAANKAITQYVEVVPQMNKQRRLEQILRSQERGSKVIIFCSTKRLCDQLTRSIGRNFGAAAIHGDKSQGERDWVLNQFRSGKSPILVATDVAARGLDVKDIRMVINYDFPTGIDDYVHRIGRTGRAGATGVSYTFFSEQDRKHAADLVKVLEGANQLVPPEVQEMAVGGRPSFVKGQGGMPRGDSGGGRFMSGGRGGMRDGAFAGRGGQWDEGFGGHRGRNDSNGRGNRGRGFPGPGRGSFGRGRQDSGLRDRYNNDGRGQHNNRRGICDSARGKNFSRNSGPSADMVSTWDTRSSSSESSRSRSRSRSPSRTLTRRRIRSRSRSRSHDRFRGSHLHNKDQDHLKSGGVDPPESNVSTLPQGGLLSESTGYGSSLDGVKPNLEPVADVGVPT